MDGVIHRVRIKYQPQTYQKEVHDDKTRFKVIVRGRRGGKTEEEIQDAVRDTISNPGLHWITGPTFRQIKSIIWTRLKAIIRIDPQWKINEQELYIEYPLITDDSGIATRLELKGVDKEDSLVGVGLRSLRCDEAALYKPHIWPQILRPMLADHQASASFYTTPRGRNWLYDLFLKGLDPNEVEWKSWRQPSSINKYLPKAEVEEMKKDMSARLFKQEVLAEFLEDEAGVFRKIRLCTVGALEVPIEGRMYVMGVDLAKSHDFTVITVVDTVKRHVVAFDRFQDIEWREQKARIQDIASRYNNALCFIDSTGVGEPIYEDLLHSGVAVEPYKFNNETKVRMIRQLEIAVEERLVTWPKELEILTQEIMDYEYTLSPAGNIIYGAPEGKHDDCVISLGLAVWGIRNHLKEVQLIQDRHPDEMVDRQGQGELVSTGYLLGNVHQEEDNYGGY